MPQWTRGNSIQWNRRSNILERCASLIGCDLFFLTSLKLVSEVLLEDVFTGYCIYKGCSESSCEFEGQAFESHMRPEWYITIHYMRFILKKSISYLRRDQEKGSICTSAHANIEMELDQKSIIAEVHSICKQHDRTSTKSVMYIYFFYHISHGNIEMLDWHVFAYCWTKTKKILLQFEHRCLYGLFGFENLG